MKFGLCVYAASTVHCLRDLSQREVLVCHYLCVSLVCKTYNIPEIYMYVNTFLYLSQIETLFMKGG